MGLGAGQNYILSLLSQSTPLKSLSGCGKKPPFRRGCIHVAIAYYLQFRGVVGKVPPALWV